MKFGVSRSVKGIRPEARETAKQAARRAGMSLSDWLNHAITNAAEHDGDDDDELFGAGEDAGDVNAKLDSLSRRLDQLARGPQAYAPPHLRGATNFTPPPVAYAQSRAAYAPQPFAHLDNAVAEIAARRRALNGEPAPAPMHAPMLPPMMAAPPVMPMHQEPPAIVRTPMPQQDLSGLEEQLRQITDRIDTLRTPGVEQAINALRDELAQIGHALNEAMPRQAIDAIERQIQGLTHRLAEGRQAGVDAGALTGLEHGLAEVRDTLRNLTPAENLAGFHEAIDILGQKIDYIVAQKDPATLQQLETAVTTLRQVSSHVASNEAVAKLASDVAMLAEKIDRLALGGGGGALDGLEARITALSDALAQRSQSGAAVPAKLELLVGSLADKIEKLQSSRGDNVAFGHLEERIVKLVEKLDASDSRLTHLEAIERGLGDLLVNMETVRSQGGAPRDSGVHELKADIARTQDELQSVNGALGQVLERLAMIEQGVLGEARGPMLAPEKVGRIVARAVPIDPAPPMPIAASLPPPPAPAPIAAPVMAPAAPLPRPAPPEPEPVRRPPPRAKAPPINPDLPPDQPLEPGSGPPRFRADPGARIAASEAALGDAMPPADPGPEGKSGFLAAARRAAKAALRDKSTRKAPPRQIADDYVTADEDKPSLRGRLAKRVKSLFVAASVIAIVIGLAQLGGSYLQLSKNEQDEAAKLASEQSARPNLLSRRDANPAPTGSTPEPAAPTAQLPGAIPPSTQFGFAGQTSTYNPALPESAMRSVPGLTGPAQDAPDADITGSVSKGRGVNADDLPSSFGAPLRQAAVAGDPAGAYEIGLRYAEGRGVAANAPESARWFERAARNGLAPAQFRLGGLYEKGIGVTKNLEKAREAYKAAANQGNAKAMHNLAVLYAEGADGKPDYPAATQWFRKAANYGIADSQYNLAILCARGLGGSKDMTESYKWFALAAAGGDKEAVKKRDEVAAHLDPKALAAVQAAVKSWTAQRQPSTAINVSEPAGGWDGPKPVAEPRKTRTSAAEARR
jgi:localization factor PodJL